MPNTFMLLGVLNNLKTSLVGNSDNLTNPKKDPSGKNFFSYGGKTIQGKNVRSMRDLAKGKKAILVVNVASK